MRRLQGVRLTPEGQETRIKIPGAEGEFACYAMRIEPKGRKAYVRVYCKSIKTGKGGTCREEIQKLPQNTQVGMEVSFPRKPPADVISSLKANGYRYAYSEWWNPIPPSKRAVSSELKRLESLIPKGITWDVAFGVAVLSKQGRKPLYTKDISDIIADPERDAPCLWNLAKMVYFWNKERRIGRK